MSALDYISIGLQITGPPESPQAQLVVGSGIAGEEQMGYVKFHPQVGAIDPQACITEVVRDLLVECIEQI